MTISVIIPLYNKEAEIARTLRSVLGQTRLPDEIVVVDDGSTDRSAAIVEEFNSPIIRLIHQSNSGETAARNRAMSEARGDFFALIDADDEWHAGFLESMARLIEDFPEAGLYSSGFEIVNTDGIHPAHTPKERGLVDFFRVSMSFYVSIPSASVVPSRVVEAVGGFPEGMRLGGDQFFWTLVARQFPVAFTPERLVRYWMAASNRSAAIYKPEVTNHSFSDLYDPNNPALNEYIARVALGKAITISAKGGTKEGLETERFFAYNRLSKRLWRRLWVLNRLPARWRPILHELYSRLAWLIMRRGL